MKKTLIFIDTETSGKDADDRLCQLAYIAKQDDKIIETYNELFYPGKKISAEASSVNHISNKMVVDKPRLVESSDYTRIKNLLEDESSIFIAHNAVFDLGMLAKEDIVPSNFICTLRVARYLDKQGKLAQYKLQYLRYFLDIEIEAAAHDALGDVLVLCELFPRLYKSVGKELGMETPEIISDYDQVILDKMIEISSQPSLLHTFTFGKHAGKKISDVAKTDRGYLEWWLKQKLESEDDESDWIYTLEYFLK